MLAAAPAGRTGVCIPKPLRKPRLASAASRRKRARAQRRGVRLRGCSSCSSVFIRGHQRETRTAGPVLLVLFFLTARLCHTAYAGVMSARDLRHDGVAADCAAQWKSCSGCRGADGVVRRTVDFWERTERFTELGRASSARRAALARRASLARGALHRRAERPRRELVVAVPPQLALGLLARGGLQDEVEEARADFRDRLFPLDDRAAVDVHVVLLPDEQRRVGGQLGRKRRLAARRLAVHAPEAG